MASGLRRPIIRPAIEGNTLVLKQVEQLLGSEGRAVGDKELSEYLEVRGYADAAGWVYGRGIEPGGWNGGRLITLSEVREVHSLASDRRLGGRAASAGTAKERPGSFRERGLEPFPGGMRPRSGRGPHADA